MVSDDVRERVTSYIRHQAGKSHESLAGLVSTSQAGFIDAVGAIDDATARREPAPGEWSLRELVRHVITSEAAVAHVIETTSRGQEPRGRGQIGMMAEDAGEPYPALIERLRQTNQRLLDVIAALPAEANMTLLAPHPFFGDLNCLEWAVFQRVHDMDHVQHAGKILEALRA